jgi:ABC-type amino acid transport substrate-binding protein
MDVIVEITQAVLLPELMTGLADCGCRAESVTRSACRVVQPYSSPEARVELVFFLRAWEIHHPGVETAVNYLR